MTETEDKEEKTIPFYPDHITTEFWVTIGIIVVAVIVGVIGLISPIGLEPEADPMITPEHTKPEWYFLFLYELLKHVPKTTGVLIPIAAVAVLILWPFFDRRKDTHLGRRIRIGIATVAMIAIVVLTVLGFVS